MAPIQWARRSMPLSGKAARSLGRGAGLHIGMNLPFDPANAALALWLIEAGFKVSVLSQEAPTQASDLRNALSDAGAVMCETSDAFKRSALDIVLDGKGEFPTCGSLGGVLTASHLPSALVPKTPVIDVGASPLIAMCVWTHGAGQSCVSGFLDLTNLQIAGSQVLVIGYGALGKGIAQYARSYGAQVLVCEDDPLKAAAAKLDGHRIAQIDDGLAQVSAVFHAAYDGPALSLSQIERLPNGAFLCAASTKPDAFPLAKLGQGKPIRDCVTQHELSTGQNIKLMCQGTPIQHRSGKGLPLEYADVLVAAQLYAVAELSSGDCALGPGVHLLPAQIETALARAFLQDR